MGLQTSLGILFWCVTILTVNFFFLVSIWHFPCCNLCELTVYHWEEPGFVSSVVLEASTSTSGREGQQCSPPWPTLLKAKLTLLPQTPLMHHVLPTLNHLSGPVLDFLRFIYTYTLPPC